MSEDIKMLQEEVSKFLHDGQERISAVEERGQKTDEGVERLREEFVKASEQFQEMAGKIKAEEEERKQLEAMIARQPEADPEKAKADPEYAKAFSDYIKRKAAMADGVETKNAEQLLDFYGIKASDEEKQNLIIKAGLVGSNPDGGYLAPIDAVRFISTRVFETSPVRQVANVISTAREAISVIIDDQEPDNGWVSELDARPGTDTPQIAELEIPTHEQYAEPKLSTKILDDASINIENWLQQKVARKFARTENTAFILGSGVKQPTGILTYPSWATNGNYERFALEHRETATVGTLNADDIIDLVTDLLEEYQANASFMMHRKIWGEVMQLKDNEDQYLLSPVLLFSGVSMQLQGRPVNFAGDMEDAITEGEPIMIYGDFREGYTIVDRIGIRVLRDPYTDKRFVKYYTTKRVGAAVTNYQALKVLDVQAS